MNNSTETPGNFASGVMKKARQLPDQYQVWPQEDGDGNSPFYKPLIPAISLPKGGNVPEGIVEQCSVVTMDGTARLKLPLPLSRGRGGFTPALSLHYNHREGNGAYGMGWQLSLPVIRRKTGKQLPAYRDDADSDTFELTGTGDLVPKLKSNGEEDAFFSDNTVYFIKRYLPRIEGGFSRMEYIRKQGGNEGWWRITTRDNITTWYGLNTEACIADPEQRDHILEWLPQLSTDHKGNIHLYRYVKENLDQVVENQEPQEKNRCNGKALFTHTYLKRLQYNNVIPWFVSKAQVYEPILPNAADFLMETVWDYGDHSTEHKSMPDRQWPVRTDPFSVYRSGFEIRTYRKCRRILQFHHFAGLNGHDLVQSLNFSYKADKGTGAQVTTADTLIAVWMRGYTYNEEQEAWYHKDLPAVTFDYEPQSLQHKTAMQVETAEADPVLQKSDDRYPRIGYGPEDNCVGWLYSNNSNKDGTQIHAIDPKNIFAADGATDQSLIHDLRINWDSPFTRLLAIDEQTNILLTEDRVWVLHSDEDKPVFTDVEKGPLLLFRDTRQSIFLADMSGDGLADLVRIKNDGITEYWPNRGHGIFGAKVQMKPFSVCPQVDFYDLNRIALADCNGNGLADLIYLGKDTCVVFSNLAGNSWSKGNVVPIPEEATGYDALSVFDFKGDGGCCLVWSQRAEKDKPVLLLDLTQGRKPCRMRRYDDGRGKTVSFAYKSSTQYYREDKDRGVTGTALLSAPVDCVSEVRVFDEANDSLSISTYTYRRGYFDPEEQTFRGFAFAATLEQNGVCSSEKEQWSPDVVLTRNWFDPGSGAHRNLWVNTAVKEQYFFPEWEETLQTSIEPGLTTLAQKEAFRALAGLPVREEVYKFKEGAIPLRPVSVTAQVYAVSCVQPLPVRPEEGDTRHAVFLVSRQQKLTFNKGLNITGAEVVQELLLGAYEYGHVTKEARILYSGSRFCDKETGVEQFSIEALVRERNFTNDILGDNLHYRLRLPYETKIYGLSGQHTGMLWTASHLFDLLNGIGFPSAGQNKKQLLTHHLIRFKNNRADDVPLDTGALQSLAIPHAGYRKVVNTGVEKQCKVSCVTDIMLKEDSCARPGDKCKYWICSGMARYDQPLTNFFTPGCFIDAANHKTSVVYWGNDYLLPSAITDPAGNTIAVTDYNWRNLKPVAVDHYEEGLYYITYDALGVPVALTHKSSGAGQGQQVITRFPDLYDFSDMEARAYFFENPELYAPVLLGNAVWRYVYDLEKCPAATGLISRTGHQYEAVQPTGHNVGIACFDAEGNTMMS